MIIVEPASSGGRRINKAALTRFLLQAQAAIGLSGEVNVLLAGNRTLHRLNLDFRKKNKPTDVLSFPAPDASFEGNRKHGIGKPCIGDLAISVEIAGENADHFGHALEMELKVLLLHGLLHLAGYDHETDNGAMARKERALRRQLGLKTALIERTSIERTSEFAASSQRTSQRSGHRSRKNQALSQKTLHNQILRTQIVRNQALRNQTLKSQTLAN